MFSPAELSALADEITNDPAGVGYPSLTGLEGNDLESALAETARKLITLTTIPNPTPQGNVPSPINPSDAIDLFPTDILSLY